MAQIKPGHNKGKKRGIGLRLMILDLISAADTLIILYYFFYGESRSSSPLPLLKQPALFFGALLRVIAVFEVFVGNGYRYERDADNEQIYPPAEV